MDESSETASLDLAAVSDYHAELGRTHFTIAAEECSTKVARTAPVECMRYFN